MNKAVQFLAVLACGLMLAACQPASDSAGPDLAALQQDMQKRTEELLWVHLRLDTAATEISKAEMAAREGNASGAEFHAAEAYRALKQADEKVLDLGRSLQQMVNLDSRK